MTAPPAGTLDPVAAADTLRTLAHPARLRIALLLLGVERSVAGIEAALGLRQPNLSQQLGALRDAGLVASRREAKSVFYRLAGPDQERLVGAIRHGFCGPALPPTGSVPPPLRPTARPLLGASFALVGDAV